MHRQHVGHGRVQGETDAYRGKDERDVEQVPCQRQGGGQVLLGGQGDRLPALRLPATLALEGDDLAAVRQHERERRDDRGGYGDAFEHRAERLVSRNDQEARACGKSGAGDRERDHGRGVALLQRAQGRVIVRGGRYGGCEAFVAAHEIRSEGEQQARGKSRQGEHAHGCGGDHGDHAPSVDVSETAASKTRFACSEAMARKDLQLPP